MSKILPSTSMEFTDCELFPKDNVFSYIGFTILMFMDFAHLAYGLNSILTSLRRLCLKQAFKERLLSAQPWVRHC